MNDDQPNPIAIAALVCGLISLPCSCCCYGLPFNLFAVILGIVALVTMGSNPEGPQGGKPFAWAGIGMGVSSFVLAIFWIIFGVAANLMQAAGNNF